MNSDKKLKVINLFAGPGAGKSTTAAGLFHLLKLRGVSVEYVSEYAKHLVWEKRLDLLQKDPLYIFAKQHRWLSRLKGQVDYVVMDSPLLLSTCYADKFSKNFSALVVEMYSQYDNYNFFLKRVKPFSQAGRVQNYEEAKQIDSKVKLLLDNISIPYTEVIADNLAPEVIFKNLFVNEK